MSRPLAEEKGNAAVQPQAGPRESDESSAVSFDKDVAIGLVGEHAREIDPAVEAKVLRKIDWFLIPAMIVGERPSPPAIDGSS
jgi:hypothetical protein